MNAFSLFPSWSGTVSFSTTQYLNFQIPGNSMGSTPGSSVNNPVGNSNGGLTAFGQSMAGTSTCTLNFNLGAPQGTLTYQVIINSLGGRTSSYQPPTTTSSPTNWLNDIVSVITDLDVLANFATDPVADLTLLYGIIDSVVGMAQDAGASSSYTNQSYPAAYNGINVTAALSTPISGATFAPADGANNYLLYENSTTALPLEQQNDVLVLTWRTSPSNTSSSERNSADTLLVVVLNQGLFSASNMQQCLNNAPPVMSSEGKMQYKPTKEQAEDTMKLLGILTAISKKSLPDTKNIIDMFGINGEFEKAKGNPGSVSGIKVKLKGILEKYEKEFPVIRQYITKLEQTR